MKSKLDDEEVERERGAMDSVGERVLITQEGLWWKSLEKQAVPYLMGKY